MKLANDFYVHLINTVNRIVTVPGSPSVLGGSAELRLLFEERLASVGA